MIKKENKLKKCLNWLDNKILLLLSSFLIIFIPLYPKLPLFDAIPGYLVRVRLEDFLILLTIIIWTVQFYRKKVTIEKTLAKWIGVYIFVGFLSVVSSIFLIKTVPFQSVHLAKTLLHFFRYIEYFSLFFIVFSSIKSRKDIKIIFTALLISLAAVSFYGYGQKHWYWPVYSTMNREFSKGMRLYLTEHARVQSTFGGHYDAAAFLVIALPFTYAIFLKLKKKRYKVILYLLHLMGLWLLILTASRASFFAYIASTLLIILLIAIQQKSIIKKLLYVFGKSFAFSFTVIFMMFFFGNDMYERFLQIIEGYPQAHDAYHNINRKRKETTEWALITVGLREPGPPPNSISLNDAMNLENVMVPSDQQPSTNRPSDVYVDVPDIIQIATKSADGTETFIMVERDRTWSENAHKYGLSLAIRLDTLWPNAIKGFMKNPLLGSGYATLNKEGTHHFIEADSTDNNFLRTLGETGLAGLIAFYGIVLISIARAIKYIKSDDRLVSSLALGFIAASVGLLINALYIDVFAASKVAFIYWAITGFIMGVFNIANAENNKIANNKKTKTKKKRKIKKKNKK